VLGDEEPVQKPGEALLLLALLVAATDVGGTFTDLVYFSTDPETGRQSIVTAKSDTTPPDFEVGVMNVLGKSGVSLEQIDFLAHGTTIVINALTEHKGVRTSLITTERFRDSLAIDARGNRPDFFNLHYEKPAPFVPRYLRVADFNDLVIPELQRRGVFRTEYEGSTLRENLGLPVPGEPVPAGGAGGHGAVSGAQRNARVTP
jgi:hypothetical protein